MIKSVALVAHGRDFTHHLHELSLRKARLNVLEIGDTPVDGARSMLVELGLRRGYDVLVFIDDDVGFTREDYDAIVETCVETQAVATTRYANRSGGGTIPDEEHVTPIPERPGFYRSTRAGMGFTAIHRQALERIQKHHELRRANFRAGGQLVQAFPFFLPMVSADSNYLNEDWAFCERARLAGISMYVDPRPRVTHFGTVGYQTPPFSDRS